MSRIQRGYLLLELIVLFVALPLLYFFDLIPFHKVVPLIILIVYCAVILFLYPEPNANRFKLTANWGAILLRFSLMAVLIAAWIKFFSTHALLADFTENKKLLLMTLIYPFSSAFPQELIFREFFFSRYRSLFQTKTVMVLVNIVLFAFAHIYFANWTILLFTVIGGAIFTHTYLKTKSLLVVTIEHTMYGMLILSSGLSGQFYKAF
jgi:uncharacterized protein